MSRLLLCVASVFFALPIFAQEAAPKPVELTPQQKELVALIEPMSNAYNEFYTAARKITDETEREKFYEQNDPGPSHIPKLEAFQKPIAASMSA